MFGIAIAARITAIATTIISSSNEKPRDEPLRNADLGLSIISGLNPYESTPNPPPKILLKYFFRHPIVVSLRTRAAAAPPAHSALRCNTLRGHAPPRRSRFHRLDY